MNLWHASYELRLTAAGLAAATATESLRLAVEAGKQLGLDTSG
jgi:hypothetical protein